MSITKYLSKNLQRLKLHLNNQLVHVAIYKLFRTFSLKNMLFRFLFLEYWKTFSSLVAAHYYNSY